MSGQKTVFAAKMQRNFCKVNILLVEFVCSVFNRCYDMAFSDYYIIPDYDSFIFLLMNSLYFLGGLVYLSRKNKDAIKVNYKSGFFITTNNLPNFGNDLDQEAVY